MPIHYIDVKGVADPDIRELLEHLDCYRPEGTASSAPRVPDGRLNREEAETFLHGFDGFRMGIHDRNRSFPVRFTPVQFLRAADYLKQQFPDIAKRYGKYIHSLGNWYEANKMPAPQDNYTALQKIAELADISCQEDLCGSFINWLPFFGIEKGDILSRSHLVNLDPYHPTIVPQHGLIQLPPMEMSYVPTYFLTSETKTLQVVPASGSSSGLQVSFDYGIESKLTLDIVSGCRAKVELVVDASHPVFPLLNELKAEAKGSDFFQDMTTQSNILKVLRKYGIEVGYY